MRRIEFGTLAVLMGAILLSATPRVATAQTKAPPGAPYKEVCKLVQLPCFLPTIGTLYVDPSTLPAGPWLAYDRQGNLVSTIYMVPIKDMDDHKNIDALKTATGERVDHVDVLFNPGHPGVSVPHYHIVLWYISPEKAKALK